LFIRFFPDKLLPALFLKAFIAERGMAVTGDELRIRLGKYVPGAAVETCFDWIRRYRISVRIKHTRQSKLGDYRPPFDGNGHIITINHELNPFAFLITFTHEVAHLTCYLKHGNRVLPHGAEWKAEFRLLLHDFLETRIFPSDVAEAVQRYLINPAASSCGDVQLSKALAKYDNRESGWVHLEEIPYNGRFRIRNGKEFIKGHRLRKNFTCFSFPDGHRYFIHPLMEVYDLNLPEEASAPLT
jgi:hypothetical protein